jgi:2-methylaconitate cis-trans-isomerase PrpF
MISQRSIPASIVRGGTSKGIFVREEDLPPSPEERDALILELMGSPDQTQIDGLGGTHSHTSKLVAISPSERDDCDVDYLFAQVGVDKPVVDYGGNCGNLTSAVGPYAIDAGLVEPVEPVTIVRLYNKNTRKRIDAYVPVQGGRSRVQGDHLIAGVPGSGAKIVLDFLDPAGSVFERLFPTGSPVDEIEIPDGTIEVSFVDVTNPLVLVRAADIGVRGDELPAEMNRDSEFLGRVERLRGACAWRLGLVDDPERAAHVTPGIPKLAFVSTPRAYVTSTGEQVHDEDIDILARIMSMQKVHHAYAMTGVMCTAAASRLPGTIPHEVARASGPRIRLGHPKGVAEAEVEIGEGSGGPTVRKVSVTRTARHLMTGEIFYRAPSLVPAGNRTGR